MAKNDFFSIAAYKAQAQKAVQQAQGDRISQSLNAAIAQNAIQNEARKADHLAQMAAAAIAKRAEQNVTMPVQKSSAELRQEAQTARDAYEAEKERAEKLRIAEAKKSATGSTYGAASQQEDSRKALEKAAGEVFANYGAKASKAESTVPSKERELKAKADYYEAQKNTAEIQATTEQNLKELESWSEEDRNNLDRYITERAANQNYIFSEPAFDNYNLNPIVEKYGDAKVRQMAETLEWSRSQKLAEDTRKAAKNANPILGNIARVGTNIAGTVTAPIEYAKEMANRTGQYATLNPNNIGTVPSVYGSTVLQETSAKIKGDGTSMLRNLAAIGYQGGMSVLDNLARIAISGGSATVSAAIAASGAFSNGLQQYSAQGADPGQAALMAFSDAGLEYVTEKLSDSEMLEFFKGGTKPEKIKKFLWQTFGVEPLSEEVNLFAGIAAEAAILGDKAAINQQIGEMVAGGMSYEEASREAWRQVWEEAKQTYAVSMISGAGQAAVINFAGNVARDMQAKADARNGVQPQQTAAAQEAPKVSKEQMIANAVAEATGGTPAQIDKAEDSTVVNTNPATHTPEEQEIIEAYQNSVDDNLVEYVQTIKDNPGQKMPHYQLNDVTERAAGDIQQITGIDVRGNKTELDQRAIEHIFKRHGEKGKADHSMRDVNDIARIQYVIDNYDSIENGGSTSAYRYQNAEGKQVHAQTVLIKKKVNGTYFVVEAVPDTKKKTLYVVSAYMSKNGQQKTASSLVGDAKAYRSTSENEAESNAVSTGTNVPTNIVANNGQNVNSNLSGTHAVSQGQIQGTGAAERGFTPKQALINEYGNIPEGENPVRPDQMPRSTNGNDRVSHTARTAVEARVTPDEFVPLIENRTVRGGFSYIPITNNATVEAATQRIRREGWRTARANWTAQIRAGVSSPEITATGALLYNHAVNAGDHQEAMDILMDYQMAVRNTAQALQAARILKTLTPSDRLYMIRRSVQQMVEDMHLRRPVTIDENLARQYQNAGTQEEADEILEEIAQNVARQIPPNVAESFTALRYLNMLGNFRTQVRNVAGNMGSKLVYGFKDKVGAAIETIVDAVTPGGIERTKSFTTDRNTRQAAAADYEAVQDWIMSNGRYDDNRESGEFARMVQENRRMLPPGLEQARRLTNWAMETGDAIFARDAYARALAGYLNARGIHTNDLSTVDPDVLDRGREYAVRQAQEQTFRDNNQVSDFVSGIMRGRDTPTWARILGEGIMPFRRTPANVLVRAEEYSPLGLINSSVNTIRAARGEISGANLVDSWAKTLTGTALFALGTFLANNGVLSGGPDEDDEKDEFDQLNGKQDYSLNITVDGKTYSYTIDWATPAAMPMFMGAQLQKALDGKTLGELKWADIEKVLTSVGDPLIQMSMLQGVNDTLENIRHVENNMGQFLINATLSYLTQGLTNTLLGQIERSTEETRQTTYVDKDSNMPEWLQRQLGKASQKIPGWDYQQTDYLNAWGETEKNEGGLLYNMLSPGYISEEQKSAVSDELYRLREATGENVFPQPAEKTVTYTGKDGTLHKDYNLSAEQFETLQKTEGQEAAKLIADLVGNADFAKLTDNQKVGVIWDVYAYAAEQGKKAALDDYHSNADAWIQNMGSNKTEALVRRSVVNTLNNAISQTMSNMKNGWKTTPAAEAEREELYDSYKAMSAAERRNIREDADSNTANYLEARDAGTDHDDFVRVAQQLYNIKPEKGYGGARTVQKAEAISRTPGLSEKEKELFVKQQVSDAQDKNIDDLKKLWKENDELTGTLTMSRYAQLYRDYEDYTKGNGKKYRTVEKWAKEMGISKKTAKALYDIFAK